LEIISNRISNLQTKKGQPYSGQPLFFFFVANVCPQFFIFYLFLRQRFRVALFGSGAYPMESFKGYTPCFGAKAECGEMKWLWREDCLK